MVTSDKVYIPKRGASLSFTVANNVALARTEFDYLNVNLHVR